MVLHKVSWTNVHQLKSYHDISKNRIIDQRNQYNIVSCLSWWFTLNRADISNKCVPYSINFFKYFLHLELFCVSVTYWLCLQHLTHYFLLNRIFVSVSLCMLMCMYLWVKLVKLLPLMKMMLIFVSSLSLFASLCLISAHCFVCFAVLSLLCF